jgi:hypothetical protein
MSPEILQAKNIPAKANTSLVAARSFDLIDLLIVVIGITLYIRSTCLAADIHGQISDKGLGFCLNTAGFSFLRGRISAG